MPESHLGFQVTMSHIWEPKVMERRLESDLGTESNLESDLVT